MSRALDKLRRVVSPGRRFIPEVDGLRFVAIGLIFIYHVGELVRGSGLATTPPPWLLGQLSRTGYYGVDLFFAISGFVLALPFARQHLTGASPVRLRAYYMRRLTRLEPPYLVVLFSDFLIRGFATGDFGFWRHTLASAVYQHNLIYGVWSPTFGISWSLEVEVQFYLLAPFLSKIFLVRWPIIRRPALVTAIVVGAALCGSPRIERLNLSVLGHFHEFLVGFLLADLYVASWNESPKQSLWWDVVSMVGWPTLAGLVARRAHVNGLLPVVVFWVYYASFRGRLSRRVFSAPGLTTIGGMCYTIYLVHVSVIEAVVSLCVPLKRPASFGYMFAERMVVLLPSVLCVSLIFFLLIERPCMNSRWPWDLRAWLGARARRIAAARAGEG
jgi:peptidoglycan/LPS O-acetylase OafA/YrhL